MIRIIVTENSITVEAPDTVLTQRHRMNQLLALVAAAQRSRQPAAPPAPASQADMETLPGLFEPTHEFIDGEVNDDTEYWRSCKGRKIAIANLDVDGMVNGFFCDDKMPTAWIDPKRLRPV